MLKIIYFIEKQLKHNYCNNTNDIMTSLVFDIETTGLPERNGNKYFPFYESKRYDSARIVSIAFKSDVEEKYFIIKPTFPINNSHIHGITYEMAQETGVSFDLVIDYLTSIIDKVDTLVAHNIDFDYNILLAEIHRFCPHNGSPSQELIYKLKQKKQYCTMKESIMVCKIKNQYGKFKYPKLIELYGYYFNDTFNAHNALEDTRATAKCYAKLCSG